MLAGHAGSASQHLLIESRHKIALSRVAVARSLFAVTRCCRIAGASDTDGTESHRCRHHDLLHFQGHGSYNEVCAERDEFAAEFSALLVSPVMRSKTGVWEWTFCAECPANQQSQNADPAS
jgi:hypothetical protein